MQLFTAQQLNSTSSHLPPTQQVSVSQEQEKATASIRPYSQVSPQVPPSSNLEALSNPFH